MPTKDNTVEAVARAICEARTPKGRELRGDNLAHAIAYHMPEARVAIRATLLAIREPDEAMKSVEGLHWGYSCHVCGGLTEGWQAMIDKLLEE